MNHFTTSHSATLRMEKKTLFGLGITLIALAALYSYFVMLSIVYAAEREELVSLSHSVSEEVSDLERKYLSYSNTMTEGAARSHGFVAISSRLFVERGPSTVGAAR